MRLDEYEWSRNPRGIHNTNVYIYHLDRYQQIRSGWVKLVSAEDEFANNVPELLRAGITPIIRIYRPGSCGQPADARAYADIRRYVQAGARWFELWNEPNLGNEWPAGLPFAIDPTDRENVIAPLMTHWLDWAERVIDLGGYPGFIPLAESTSPPHAAIPWLEAMVGYLREAHNQRFRAVIGGGLWCATHPYIYNHFYQEIPGRGPLSARPPDQQNAAEGGWHFEYPYDPICQGHDPGRTVWGGTALTPLGDPVGLTAMGRAFNELLGRDFGAGAVPVVGTEGGIWPWPGPGEAPRADDTRYPGVTWASHAEATTALFNWIASDAAPPWFFGLTLWKENDYWENPAGAVPTVTRLAGTAPPVKNVPALSILEGVEVPSLEEMPAGPGPVHGSPDYHFVILTPGLDPEWFFQTAEAYWARFRPAVMDTDALIAVLPYTRSVAVTVIARPDQVAQVNAQIRDRWPNVWYDLIIAQTSADLSGVFAQRLAAGRPFG